VYYLSKIHILSENISNKIAAGEVIERPASVVKELVENSIDAGATSIIVEINGGGIAYIRVTDNGCGMDAADSKNCFIRHATSKIYSEDDLSSIKSLGFRGEALASIASVSYVELLTKTKEDTYGTKVIVEGGTYKSIESTGCPDGTTVIVKNLFYNTPARLKFLRKESREGGIISDILLKLALSKPLVSFKYINNGKVIFNTPGDGSLKNAILVLYGKDIYDSLVAVSYQGNILSINGFIGKPDIARSNRNFQTFFVNNRYVKNKILSTAVDSAYKTFLTTNKFAFCIFDINIYPDLVDVNVHPAKAEVRFQDEREVFSALFNTVRNGLTGEIIIPDMEKKEFFIESEQQKLFKEDYSNTVLSRNPEKSSEYKENDNLYEAHLKEYNNTSINININEIKEDKYKISDNNIISPESSELDGEVKNLLPPLVVIGQCHYTYILAQGPDTLYIVDQHAAHERILYEKFKALYEEGRIHSQQLLTPLLIDLTPEEISVIKDNSNIISKLGFDFEYFGNNSVMLRSVPMIFGEPQLKKFFSEIIDLLDGTDSSGKSTIDSMLYTMACKGAVKANKKLSNKEMEELLENLKYTTNPYTCPHGRPTIIKLTKTELEKKFKRIQ